ncbi:protein cordon-bleu-like [Takifugu flavidus]|nr:protein cordon-bleu-like [Takifugu flavidus]XP_056883926.1 protein cordon-bleu-like [Takifugu flavidus]
MEEQVNPLERDHTVAVVLPGGLEKNATVHGSKPVMDLLVTLCASYHMNPSGYTVEVLSANKNTISFKPNSPIGSLEVEKIVLKPREVEEKIRRPYMPEASVRLLVNYNKAHKTVVRVSPTEPLELLLPVICDKCEFSVQTTVLLRDAGSDEPLDTTKTLNELGLRELFAKDTEAREPVDLQHRAGTPEAAMTPTKVVLPPPAEELPKGERKHKKNTGFLSLFRKGKKKAEPEGALSAPVSPSLAKQVATGVNAEATSCSSTPADVLKKRRAPQPPMAASQSVPTSLGTCHLRAPQRSSAESTLRRLKRRAPPPPRANLNQTSSEVEDSLSTVEEQQECEESISLNLTPSPPQSSPELRQPRFSSSSTLSSLHDMVDPYLPLFEGKDLSDARSALAKVLTSSVSRGALVRRLRISGMPKSCRGSTLTPETRKCSGDGGTWADLESVPSCSLPIQPEWEEPIHRVSMTTFKGVPSKPTGPEPPAEVPDQIKVENEPGVEGSPDPETDSELQTEEDLPGWSSAEPCSPADPGSDRLPSLPPSPDLESHVCPDSPLTEEEEEKEEEEKEEEEEEEKEEEEKEEEEEEDGPEVIPVDSSEGDDGEPLTEGQINSEEQKEVPQSPAQLGSTEMDPCGPNTDETGAEGEVLQDEAVDHKVDQEVEDDAFPPPPSPVFFTEDTNILDEVEGEPPASCLPSSSQPSSPASSGPDGGPGQDLQSGPQLPEPAPEPLDKTNAAPSRFAEAVALAVQKSRLQQQGRGLGPQASSRPRSNLPSTSV